MPADRNGGNEVFSPDAGTPLDPDELEGLIPDHLTTRAELNQWEALNISRAQVWLSQRAPSDPLSEQFLVDLHKQMFSDTWEWAGQLRRSDKNISPHHWTEVPLLLRQLLTNTKQQYESSNKTPGVLHEIAMRFHHLLVKIHPWPNGNGRHARLATDALLTKWGLRPFAWGQTDLVAEGEVRRAYVAALRAADGWDYGPLRQFLQE